MIAQFNAKDLYLGPDFLYSTRMAGGNLIRTALHLDLEEKILNGGVILAIVCMFFPWIGGEWLGGKTVTYSGLGFFTSFLGVTVLLLHLYLLLITLIPLTGGPQLVRKRNKDMIRLVVSALAVILTIGIWSVLTKFTFEFSRLEIHFGLYGTLIGGLIATLYSFLELQEQKRTEVHNLFHHHEESQDTLEPTAVSLQNEHHQPPPPPPSEPEEPQMPIDRY